MEFATDAAITGGPRDKERRSSILRKCSEEDCSFLKCRTKRLRKSFGLQAIRLYKSSAGVGRGGKETLLFLFNFTYLLLCAS